MLFFCSKVKVTSLVDITIYDLTLWVEIWLIDLYEVKLLYIRLALVVKTETFCKLESHV